MLFSVIQSGSKLGQRAKVMGRSTQRWRAASWCRPNSRPLSEDHESIKTRMSASLVLCEQVGLHVYNLVGKFAETFLSSYLRNHLRSDMICGEMYVWAGFIHHAGNTLCLVVRLHSGPRELAVQCGNLRRMAATSHQSPQS